MKSVAKDNTQQGFLRRYAHAHCGQINHICLWSACKKYDEPVRVSDTTWINRGDVVRQAMSHVLTATTGMSAQDAKPRRKASEVERGVRGGKQGKEEGG